MTVTEFWSSDAWMTRTRDLPAGVVSRSGMICSRRPLAGPMPATVYACPDCTSTAVDSTALDLAGAPASRIATV